MLLQAPVFERKREFQDWAQKGKRRSLKIKWRLISCYSLATLLNAISFPYREMKTEKLCFAFSDFGALCGRFLQNCIVWL